MTCQGERGWGEKKSLELSLGMFLRNQTHEPEVQARSFAVTVVPVETGDEAMVYL